jgi:CHAD domain-containing protein/adenylate cyclase class IV
VPDETSGNTKIEIEAKFIIPDYDTFVALKVRRKLADFRIKPVGTTKLTDRYFDTAERAIITAGFACRLRTVDRDHTLTFKSLTPPQGEIQRRQEIEIEVKSDQPQSWTKGRAKEMIGRLAGEAPLQPLFTIHQTRHTYHVVLQGIPVLVLSLDEVSQSDEGNIDYFELEAELLNEGNPADLNHFLSVVQQEWSLEIESRSKFERAFAARFATEPGPGAVQLSDLEKLALGKIANLADKLIAKRAMIILLSDAGLAAEPIAGEVEFKPRTVIRWQRRFAQERMAIFPANLLAVNQAAPATLANRPELGQAHPTFTKKKKKTKKKKGPVKYRQSKIGLQTTDSQAEAGRKVLGFHFAQMLTFETGTRLGEDIEALHHMRVAIRRMRTAFNLFRSGYLKREIKPLLSGLRATGQALALLRDIDVFIEKVRQDQQLLPPDDRPGLEPLLASWQQKRLKARADLLAYLDSNKYIKFKRSFLKFVKSPGLGAKPIPQSWPPRPYQLRHVAPGLVYAAYEEVRAYETLLDKASVETLHRLRLSCKRLRYTLEHLREVLDVEATFLIDEVKLLQDHLGEMNDADIAATIVSDFIVDWESHQLRLPLSERQSPTPIVTYLNANLDTRHRLVITFPEVWARFNRLEVRQSLARALANL